jgi:hypothetical protein
MPKLSGKEMPFNAKAVVWISVQLLVGIKW